MRDALWYQFVDVGKTELKINRRMLTYLARVGLLDSVSIDNVEVFWPVSGCRNFYAAEINSLNTLGEADCMESRCD